MTATLTIADRTYTLPELADPALVALPAWSDNQRAALHFCAAWLRGDATFTVHTSGSTGAPKPISLTRGQMETSARATAAALGLQAGMTALVCLPVRYIAGQMMLVRGLTLGLAMHLAEPDRDPLAGWPAHSPLDFTALVPLQLATALDSLNDYANILTPQCTILVGGAALSAELEQRVQDSAAPVYHTYGMTETATHIALRRLNGPLASAWFQPLPGVEIAADARGCLRVRGAMTRSAWVQTNDVVEFDAPPAAAFRFLGRWDNVINSGGVKVQSEAVEQAVEQAWLAAALPARRSIVLGLPDARLGQVVSLIIEGAPLPAAGEAALLTQIGTRLDRFQRPRQVYYLPQLPETPGGKLDRAEAGRQVDIAANQQRLTRP
ncbi:MAG: AMP-binding protein [Caldilineales bacterium]